jgi:ubiquinone/menaquinone biosynthesis C-methylase UbiE
MPPENPPAPLPVPDYLEQLYWWAYVRPWAVRIFERVWLVNLILFGNYTRLRDAALDELGATVGGHLLQVACVYGDLTPRLQQRLAANARLDVVDVLQVQLANLRRKLRDDPRVGLLQRDSTALGLADASYDQVLVFFLLHEQPAAQRRQTLAEVLRVLRPGGKLILLDYHGPAAWHPLRHPLRLLLRWLEPYADDLWQQEIADYLPPGKPPTRLHKQTYFGGLYQKVVIQRGLDLDADSIGSNG